LATITEIVLEAAEAPVRVAGEKATVMPAGKPVAESATDELKPFCGVLVTATCTVVPTGALTEVEFALSVNVGVGITTETATFAV
jgi:hypothetical protein